MPPVQDVELAVSDFVALLNQTLDYTYGGVTIVGELANLRVSKNRWVYFDLKDQDATVKFFGTVYQLPGPLEDGMVLKVKGQPRLHNLYGFSVNVQSMRPAGEGTIKRAAELLQAKLAAEGLFEQGRKRGLPYPPERIGLIASKQSAAYADFIKILNARWGGLQLEHIDVQVQGEPAVAQIVGAIEQFNARAEPPEVLVLIRGGGSAEDLAAFSTEQVTRAVAASRVPTLVAIGHEVDVSLAELAADRRASTPSNAAELLVPDQTQTIQALHDTRWQLQRQLQTRLASERRWLTDRSQIQQQYIKAAVQRERAALQAQGHLLEALSPQAILRRGYAVVRVAGQSVRSTAQVKPDAIVEVQVVDGQFTARVQTGKQS
jgi:exodeoxyribonuclease VII large subunit